MILVDTCAWIAHLRTTDLRLVRFLTENRVVTTEVVLGELSIGAGLPPAVSRVLGLLPRIPTPAAPETLRFIERHRRSLEASGVGWADVQVLNAASEAGALLYSTDRAARTVWRRLGFRFP